MLRILAALVNSDASKMQLLTESFQAAKDLSVYLNIFVQGASASWLCCEFRNLCLNRQHWVSEVLDSAGQSIKIQFVRLPVPRQDDFQCQHSCADTGRVNAVLGRAQTDLVRECKDKYL